MIKIAVALVIAMALVAGSACEVNAAGYRKVHKRHAISHYYLRYAAPQRYPDASGWFPHDASQLQFGSALWWDQMRRENRVNK
jgi:curli biogenesis system outer membrane secretion channel CsgG